MSNIDSMPRMVADVGGTNTRIALYNPNTEAFTQQQNFINREHTSLASVFQLWLSQQGDARPDVGCVALAAAPSGDRVEMTNMAWSFSRSSMQGELELQALKWLNDFEANALVLQIGNVGLDLVIFISAHQQGQSITVHDNA